MQMSAMDKIRKYAETEKKSSPADNAPSAAPAGESDSQEMAEKDESETPVKTADAPPPADDEDARLAAAESKANENYERFVRAAAELDNFRKRSEREKDDLRKYAVQTLAKDLLPVVDNLERALAAPETGESGEGLIKGVQMVHQELLKVLEKHHVVPFESLGKPFDPEVHQAIMQESSAEHPANTVMQEYQKGYTIHGRLCRPAMVVVSQGAGEDPGQAESQVDDPSESE